MKVFLSWSGTQSKNVAAAARSWLGDIFPDVEPWMSAEDIAAGSRWNTEIDEQLEATNFGVLCLTRENLDSKWLMFEAGRLSKNPAITRVVPYLFGLSPADVGPPLSQFQGVAADECGTLQLAQSINSLRASPYSDEKLRRTFSRWWPDLKTALETQVTAARDAKQTALRTDRQILEELLNLVRNLPIGHSDQIRSKQYVDVKRVFEVIGRIERMEPEELQSTIEGAENVLGDEHCGGLVNAQLFLDVATQWLATGKSTHESR